MTAVAVGDALNDTADLRRALDHAIYALEGIKLRAAHGAASKAAEWYCEEIRELAATALSRLDGSASVQLCEEAQSP